jgi:hypothetical protein
LVVVGLDVVGLVSGLDVVSLVLSARLGCSWLSESLEFCRLSRCLGLMVSSDVISLVLDLNVVG